MKVSGNRLCRDDGTPYEYRESPNYYRNPDGSAIVQNPELLVWHYTAGVNSLGWLTAEVSQAAAHLLISRCGLIVQLVPFDWCAWHAGRASTWNGRQNCNLFSIGIELENLGRLDRVDDKWVGPKGVIVPQSEVLVTSHKNGGTVTGWHRYTEPQIAAALEAKDALVSTYGLTQIGHEDILPAVKTDPGPAFPWKRMEA